MTSHFYVKLKYDDMDVSKNMGTPKSSILIGFSIIFTIHFAGVPLFSETPICEKHLKPQKTNILNP